MADQLEIFPKPEFPAGDKALAEEKEINKLWRSQKLRVFLDVLGACQIACWNMRNDLWGLQMIRRNPDFEWEAEDILKEEWL